MVLFRFQEFSLSANETFVISTTDRREIDSELYKELVDGKTLHLLKSVDQELTAATQERIEFLPHYHTLVQCGMYEYYASEGQKALPYAFAELIDNALSATARNTGIRRIEIRLLFDESQGGPAVVVMDNGCGMTSKQLNNWAVYRLSKFIRENCIKSEETGYVRPDPVPRSLNSDISYFGVGGKQAVFYIGQSVRMISKPAGSPDVHEFVMSKEDFERKEMNREDIYTGFIRNRKPADCSHVSESEEQFLQSIVMEEKEKQSFTAVIITGVQQEHVTFLKHNFSLWTRELAHTYHYYIHGVHGNDQRETRKNDHVSNIDIQISLVERSPRIPSMLNLREVDNDMQTLYINSSFSTFEFKAIGARDSFVEGLIRYHPFLYDQETYPVDPYALGIVNHKLDEDCLILNSEARGKRPVFECFWNGRLIPYTTVSEFEWCARPKKVGAVPLECYNRISGVLFANDRFQVSTNKLTFMDLELQLRDNNTIFTRVHNGQELRVNIQREFTNWLKECHERFDKQVMFQGFKGSMTRTDVPTKRQQSPWAVFQAIKWDGKTYKKGQCVKSVKTNPVFVGSIVHFLLYGEHEGDVYATGGYVQIALEPKELYDEVRIIPISKIDRLAAAATIKKKIEDELAKLPDQLRVTWPEGNAWAEDGARPAGTLMGPIKVEILNKKGDPVSRLPVAGTTKKLLIELKVIWHCELHLLHYWNLSKLGKYTLHLQTMLGDNSASEWAGKRLPYYTLNFSIKEGEAISFVLGVISSPVHFGVPFSIPLDFRDEFDYPTQPPCDIKPQLECSSLELSYERIIFGTTCVIKNVRAKGKMSHQNKVMKVHIPGLKQDSQSLQIVLQPGPPHTLVVFPDGDVLSVENRTPANFRVEIHDEYQNITTHPKLSVRCQLLGAPDLPVDVVDCSNTGSGVLLTKPLLLKTVNAEQILTAKFNIPNHRTVACVERKLRILPSSRISRFEVYRQEEGSEDVMVLQNGERIDWTAGDTLGNLRFRLYDEGNRLVSLRPKLTTKIKVNWTADINAEELSQGKLPALSVPSQAQREHFYLVSFHDKHTVNFSFIIYLSCSKKRGYKLQGVYTVKPHSVCIYVYGFSQASSGLLSVCGVRFVGGSLGPRELCFKYQDMKEFVRIEVTAGPPVLIKLLNEPEMPLQVVNGQGLDAPLVVLLCDEWGNPSPDHVSADGLDKSALAIEWQVLYTQPQTQTDGGEHQLEFWGSFSRNRIPGPVVKLNVIPDPNKPVELSIEYDSAATLCAGDIFPVFTVVVMSEEGTPVRTVCPAYLSMLLWKGTASGLNPPSTDLALLENSPGVDGAEYILQFNPEIRQTSVTIAAYSLPFRFCNDVEHQKVIVTLSKKKDRLSQTVLIYRDVFETSKQLKSELECQVQDATLKLNELKAELQKSGFDVSELTTVSLLLFKAILTKMENQPQRKCSIPDPFKGSPKVLGKVGHLAQVEDDDAAKVISWHILGDMDCVVTETTSAAKRIFDDTQGRQQVIPLETVFWRPNDRPLPHIRNGMFLFQPIGNPVFVKDILIFPEHVESCNKGKLRAQNLPESICVFNTVSLLCFGCQLTPRMISYSRLPKNTMCLFILMAGNCLVFGCVCAELLQQCRVAMQKASDVRSDYNSHLEHLQSPEMKQKQQELQQQEQELRDLEGSLGMCFRQCCFLNAKPDF
uniref:Structural maintenance of chromosomes flexible hinge domain containing 1 n=1 Tax=Sinocyclocheilus grahami TaxID=75366 RepID=A0A672NNC2_SINGR